MDHHTYTTPQSLLRHPIVALSLITLTFAAVSLSPAQESKMLLLQAGKLPRPMLMHGTAVVGKRIYIMGGNYEEQTSGGVQDHWPRDVYSAEIGSDAKLGEWRQEQPLLETRCYIENAVQVINDRIYVLGGNVHASETARESEFSHSDNVLWTRVNRDGTLQPWQKGESFGAKRSCAASCASDRHLYLVGGTIDGTVGMTDISCADISGTTAGNTGVETGAGEIDAPRNWRKAGDLPIPLWYLGAAVLEDRIYAWGGYAPGAGKAQSNSRVFSAPLQDDGRIGEWREETPMQSGTNSAGYCGFNDYLVSVAGRLGGGIPTSGIQFTHLQNGTAEPWQMVDTDIQTRIYHSLGLDKSKGVLYITGGKFRSGAGKENGSVIDMVQAFQLPQPAQAPSPAAAASTAQFSAPVREALATAAQSKRKVLVLFHSPAVPAAQRLMNNVLTRPEFQQLGTDYVLAAADISGDDQKIAAQYGVYRVPCLVELAPDGHMLKRSSTLSKAEDIAAFLSSRNELPDLPQ